MSSYSWGYTETFYVCQGGDASKPEVNNCATAYDAADFSTPGNWGTDDSDDGKIGPNDLVVFMDDGGDIRNPSATSGLLTIKQSGLSGKPITLKKKTGDTPIINASQIISTWTPVGAQNNKWQAALSNQEPSQVWFDGVKGTKKTSLINLDTDKDWYWDANVLYQYSTSDPDARYTSPGTEASLQGWGINLDNKSYIVIDGLTIKRSKAYGIGFINDSHNNIVQNSTITQCSADGISFWKNSGSGNDLITGNLIYDNYQSGISARINGHNASSGHEVIVSNNTVSYNGEYGIYAFGNYWIIEKNLVHHNGQIIGQSQGISTQSLLDDGSGQHNIIRYNVSHSQSNQGIAADGCGYTFDRQNNNNEMYGNIGYNNDGPYISNYESSNNLIYNNTCYKNSQGSGLTIKAEIKVTQFGAVGDWQEAENVTIKNNAAYADTGMYAVYIGDEV